MAEEPIGYRQVICPVCGRAVGLYHELKTKTAKGYYVREGKSVPYLEWLQETYSLNRPYFAVEQQHENGRLGPATQLTPEQWPEGFDRLKNAVLRALLWWKRQGWLSLKEIIDALTKA